MHSTAAEVAKVLLLPGKDVAVKAQDAATRQSAQHAVIVLRDDDKPGARERRFRACADGRCGLTGSMAQER